MAADTLVIWFILPTSSIFVVVKGLKARATTLVPVASTVSALTIAAADLCIRLVLVSPSIIVTAMATAVPIL